ncbi:hypothetical protein E5357_17060 [Hominisplanchenecus murintestinalis]|uniref:Uncharacterized protein n=1 Tax=Hominisplanchenecus murintestinalis TaxID=2941517 RepID=A0AC61QV42_9FIRM|nr:hypothetical protein [Hominisplanchenecus murintestinalis]TGX96191.1 hypothetical protein E5357_17060 [Hominisplanchenecus murintestinalis]
MARKRPMTTEGLFDTICKILKEKGKLPDILDYGLATHNPVPITNYEYDLKNNLDYGGNEGIYLDLWIEYTAEGKKCASGLGTFKTLRADDESMHIMAVLLADFIIEECAYVNANLDDFTWEGVDVHVIEKSGEKSKWGYSCGTMEAALKRKDELLKKYPKVIVRDNATRKEKIYENGG